MSHLFRRTLVVSVCFGAVLLLQLMLPSPVLAQRGDITLAPVESDLAASDSAATASGEHATPSAQVIQKIQEKKDEDITESTGRQKDKFITLLEASPAQPLSWNNFLEHAVRYAIIHGVPGNVLVLVILFPLVASFIAASRHVVGLRGFGIYIPAVLSVALVSTGLTVGLIIFTAIISVALVAKRMLKNLHLSYLPRTAMLLWVVSLAILGVLLIAPYVDLVTLMSVNIFPILILVLLSENFLDAQSSTKPSDAFWLSIETIVLAFVAGFILRLEFVQHLAILDPELVIVGTAFFNIFVGKFAGLRLSEWFRFRPIIEE